MQGARQYAAAVALVLIATGLAACSRTSARHIDINNGVYYSQEEFEKLPGRQKDKYCSNLGSALTALQTQVEEKQNELKDTRKEIESLHNQITPVERELLQVDSDIRTLTGQVAELEALPKTWTIKSGETIDIIAGYDQIYSDPSKWPRIYRANRDKIMDPAWIYPDTVLVIPRDWPTEYKVTDDETLEEIAGFWEVYGDSTQWTRLYQANKKKISDPYNLPRGLVITIPRD